MRARRGMTLVELLVALTLLGMMSALVSVTWSSLRRWDASAEAAESALRPQRVVMLLDRQWASRAALSEEDQTLGRLDVERDALRLATRRPSLHPAWPVALASYEIDRSDPGRLSLRYAETRLDALGAAVGREETVALLEGATELAWRFRVEREPEGDEPARVEWTDDPGALTLKETRLLAVELLARLESGEVVEWIGAVERSR